MRSLMNFFGGLRIRSLNPLTAGVLAFALVFGSVAHLDAQSLQFVEKDRYPVGDGLDGIAAGDLNGDGNLDLVIPSYDDDVKVLLGDGTGAFGSPTTYYGGYRETATPVLADFNNDGNIDAAISNNDGASFSSMLGDGTGALTEVWTGSTGSYPHQITGGDFNADGVPDIATISWLGYRLTVFIGQGDGTFSSQRYSMGTNLNGVAAGDFNGDGKTDLAVSVYKAEQIAQFWGNGDGTFTEGDRVSVSSGGTPHGIRAGDFNHDGVDDIAVNVSGLDQISIFLGTAGGNLMWKQNLPGYANSHDTLALADFNRDGSLDIAAYDIDDEDLCVLIGNGDGTFSEKFRLGYTDATSRNIAAGDFNGDGWPDIAVGIRLDGENAVSILINVTPPPQDTTPPQWVSGVGIQDAFQFEDNKVRIYWNRAIDTESEPVKYNIYFSEVFAGGEGQGKKITITQNNLITACSFSGYDYEFEIGDLKGNSIYRFEVRAEDSASKPNETIDIGAFKDVHILDFMTISEINSLLISNPSSIVDKEIITEMMGLSYVKSLYKEAIEVGELIYDILTLDLIGIGLSLGGLDPTAFAKNWLEERTTYMAVVGTNPREYPSDWPDWYQVVSPVDPEDQFKNYRGWPVIAKVKVIEKSVYGENPRTLKIISFHENFNRFDFLPGGCNQSEYSLCNFRHLNGEIDYNLIGVKGALIGSIESRCIDGPNVILLLHNLRSTDEESKPVYIKTPFSNVEFPNVNSVIGVYGTIGIYGSRHCIETTPECMKLIVGRKSLIPEDKRETIRIGNVISAAESPVDLHIYDSLNNHIGAIYDSQRNVVDIEIGIPNSLYLGPDFRPELIIIADPKTGPYRLEVKGIENGKYTLTTIATDRDNNEIYQLRRKDELIAKDQIDVVEIPIAKNELGEVVLTTCYWADINCDGRVNIIDIQLVAGKYGLKCGDAGYDPRCDVGDASGCGHGDCKIFIIDIQCVAGQYGWSTPSGRILASMLQQNGLILKIGSGAAEPGKSVNIPVSIEGAENFGAFEFEIGYSPGVISVEDVRLGDFPASSGNTASPVGLEIDSIDGRVKFGCFTFGTNTGPDGSGTLAVLTCRVLAAEETNLEFLSVLVTDKEGNVLAVSGTEPGLITDVEEQKDVKALPKEFSLSPNFPNPFNPATEIRYQLPQASDVRIAIYNLLGQEVRRLVDGPVEAGYRSVLWDGRDSLGREVGSGVYLVRMKAKDFVQVRKMVKLQ